MVGVGTMEAQGPPPPPPLSPLFPLYGISGGMSVVNKPLVTQDSLGFLYELCTPTIHKTNYYNYHVTILSITDP